MKLSAAGEGRDKARAEVAYEAIRPERHRERHFPEADVLAALAAAGLECLDCRANTDYAIPEQPLEELRRTKAVYIARPKTRT